MRQRNVRSTLGRPCTKAGCRGVQTFNNSTLCRRCLIDMEKHESMAAMVAEVGRRAGITSDAPVDAAETPAKPARRRTPPKKPREPSTADTDG